ncbi:MAG: MFS transporter [Alphaproteobacteria bacterium]|nr:MFS transporter [Alphaproteobacteria bacterium]
MRVLRPIPDTGASARSVAFDLLGAVLGRKRPLDEAVDAHPALPALAARDRAFARQIISTTLRRLGQIDILIDHCLERPLPPKARAVRDLLRLGVCQLLFLGTPPHAAVATTVELAQHTGHGPHKKLVNAILRRLEREGRALVEAQDAARLNTPDWLWSAWCAAYGETTCRRVAEAHLTKPPLDLTVKKDPDLWAASLDATLLATGTLRLYARGPVSAMPGYDRGAWWVQDAAAALPARLLGEVEGRRVIDLCAAPGGKTAQLLNAGARVTAVDHAPERLKRLEANLERLGLHGETVVADAAEWRPAEAADAVLLDAPCTTTGAIRRHPDVAWLKSPDDVAALAAVQARLLAAAVEMVRPGGLLIYASCSLQPEEGPGQVAALLGAGAPVAREPVRADEVGGLSELLTDEGDLRSLPCHLAEEGGMDGFFAARVRRL